MNKRPTQFQQADTVRTYGKTIANDTRGGKLLPVSAVPFEPSESGSLQQRVSIELEPIPGQLITPVMGEIVSVFVPLEAIEAQSAPDGAYPGMRQVIKDRLKSGEMIWPLEAPSDITKALRIVPKKIDGAHKVDSRVRHAYNAAVNALRRRTYVHAATLDETADTVAEAIIGDTVLQRLNAVLDPEDRVDGQVELSFGDDLVFVQGVGQDPSGQTPATGLEVESVNQRGQGKTETYQYALNAGASPNVVIRSNANGRPLLNFNLGGMNTGTVSLKDFYRAEIMDDLTRTVRDFIDQNPEYGADIVADWAHGLSIDFGDLPRVLYRKRAPMRDIVRQGMDGPNLDKEQTDILGELDFTVPIPKTELGGIVVTMVAVLPDEKLGAQPDPFFTEPYKLRNHVQDQLAIDPVPVLKRDIDSDIDTGNETDIAFYVGNNGMLRHYIDYGFALDVDLAEWEYKSAIWQLEIPTSVTPDSVLYPASLDHSIFANMNGPAARVTSSYMARINTPLTFGPTPVEDLQELEDHEVFEE